MVSIVQSQFYAVRKERQQKRLLHKENPSAAASLPLFPLHYFFPLQSECFRDGNIATTQARNGENMSTQGFVPATRAGKNPFVGTRTGYSIFICSPDDDMSIPNSFLTTVDPIVKRCVKSNILAERGSHSFIKKSRPPNGGREKRQCFLSAVQLFQKASSSCVRVRM